MPRKPLCPVTGSYWGKTRRNQQSSDISWKPTNHHGKECSSLALSCSLTIRWADSLTQTVRNTPLSNLPLTACIISHCCNPVASSSERVTVLCRSEGNLSAHVTPHSPRSSAALGERRRATAHPREDDPRTGPEGQHAGSRAAARRLCDHIPSTSPGRSCT